MTKAIEFENALSDLITEMFGSKKDIEEAIKYFGDTTIANKIDEVMDGIPVRP